MYTTKEAKKILIISLTTSQILHETLDELQETSFYKHSLKQAAQRLEKEITSTCDQHINTLWKQDEELFRKIQNGIEQIAKAVCLIDPAKLVVLAKVLEKGVIDYTEEGVVKTINLKD